jgi:dTDP-4-amino-4,6-dideoxygalactose transaminase
LYNKFLKGVEAIITPKEAGFARHVYHVYGVRVKNRDAVIKELSENGITVLIHYPIPLHLQEVYRHLSFKKGDFPVAERVASEVFSMPMYPHLKEEQIKFVADTLKSIVR